MDRELHPKHSLPVAVTAPGVATTSDDDAYMSCRAGHGYGDVLNLSSDTSSPTGGAGARSGVFIKRDEMYLHFHNQVVKAVYQLPQHEKAVYIEALEKAPAQVWKEESNPDMFLRVEDFHPS
jgi:hypothetical protein